MKSIVALWLLVSLASTVVEFASADIEASIDGDADKGAGDASPGGIDLRFPRNRSGGYGDLTGPGHPYPGRPGNPHPERPSHPLPGSSNHTQPGFPGVPVYNVAFAEQPGSPGTPGKKPGKPGHAYPGRPFNPHPGRPAPPVPGTPGEPVPPVPGRPTPGKNPGKKPGHDHPARPFNPHPGRPAPPAPGVPGRPAPPAPEAPGKSPGKPGHGYPGRPSNPHPGRPAPPVPGVPGRPAPPVLEAPGKRPGKPGHGYPGRPYNPHPGRPAPPVPGIPDPTRHITPRPLQNLTRLLKDPYGPVPDMAEELMVEEPDEDVAENGDPGFNIHVTPGCYYRKDLSAVHWTSPRFLSKKAPVGFNCSIATKLTIPRIAVFSLDAFEMTPKIRGKCRTTMYVRKPYERFNKLCGNLSGKKLYIPTSNTLASFWIKLSDTFRGFSISVHFVANAFTRLITLPKTDGKPRKGVLTNPHYPEASPSHMAEYWIKSDVKGMEIRLEMELDIKNVSYCRRDYLVVNPVGDSYYPRSTSTLLCGKINKVMSSKGGAIYLTYRSRHESTYRINYELIKV